MSPRILILGTGLIGASLGLALKALGARFEGTILGWDPDPAELETAFKMGAIDGALISREAALEPNVAGIYVLAAPVLRILEWMEQLAPVLGPHQLVTDVGSTKALIAEKAQALFNQPGRATFLPGHPMAGKESGGAAIADAALFQGATWLFTPASATNPGAPSSPTVSSSTKVGLQTEAATFSLEDIATTTSAPKLPPQTLEAHWRHLVSAIGAHTRDIDPIAHDEVCAWVSHLPQMLSTTLAALLQDTFAADPAGMAAVQAIGGRTLRETTRLGSSPYSMWRDIALTNTQPLAQSIHALEQRLQHLRENLRTPELRDEFSTANKFRAKST